MDFGVDSLLQLLIIGCCIFFAIKITGKFIKFLLTVAIIVIGIYFLLDAGIISVPL